MQLTASMLLHRVARPYSKARQRSAAERGTRDGYDCEGRTVSLYAITHQRRRHCGLLATVCETAEVANLHRVVPNPRFDMYIVPNGVHVSCVCMNVQRQSR